MSSELMFGLHAAQALLKSQPDRIDQVYFQRGRQDQRLQKVLQQVEKLQLPIKWLNRNKLDDMVDGNHQGVVLAVQAGELRDEGYLWELLEGAERPLLLILDGVTDPHNLGACLRSADAAGAIAVVAPKDRSAGINGTVRKVACGAAESVPFIPVTNLVRTLKGLQERGVWVVGAAGEAFEDVYEVSLTGPLALVMGAEGKGMRRLTRETCDQLIKIPMVGSVSSLNVSVATGVCLFEALRQRQSGVE